MGSVHPPAARARTGKMTFFDLGILAIGAQIAIIGFFLGALNIRLHAELMADDPELAIAITGFTSAFASSLIVFLLSIAMLALFLVMTCYQVLTTRRLNTLLCVDSHQPPQLQLPQGKRFHLFASTRDPTLACLLLPPPLPLLLPPPPRRLCLSSAL